MDSYRSHRKQVNCLFPSKSTATTWKKWVYSALRFFTHSTHLYWLHRMSFTLTFITFAAFSADVFTAVSDLFFFGRTDWLDNARCFAPSIPVRVLTHQGSYLLSASAEMSSTSRYLYSLLLANPSLVSPEWQMSVIRRECEATRPREWFEKQIEMCIYYLSYLFTRYYDSAYYL